MRVRDGRVKDLKGEILRVKDSKSDGVKET